MKKFFGIVFFFILYIPALLLTLIHDGVTEFYPFIYNSHQTLKFLLNKK